MIELKFLNITLAVSNVLLFDRTIQDSFLCGCRAVVYLPRTGSLHLIYMLHHSHVSSYITEGALIVTFLIYLNS